MLKQETIVIVECRACKIRRDLRVGEIAPDDYPMCPECFLPMTVLYAKHVARRAKSETP